MPSVMDIQQQQQQPTADSTNADPLVQATLALDKKQRNLLKRKEKLESYEEEAKKGKELNKDQKEALQKYPEVLGQIEVLKELNEQLKKIQAESAKNQKRLSKQAAEEKRSLVSQSLRQYAQIRYLVENRPNSLESDQSTLLDQLSSSIIPTDNSTESITRSVDTVLSIYQNAPPAIIKNLTGKTPQEVRETLDKVFQTVQSQQQQQEDEEIQAPSTQQQDQQTEIQQEEPQVQPIEEQEQQPIEQIPLTNQIFNDYPLQFDTRTQSIPLEQVMKITTFFQIDPNSPFEDENQDQSNDPNQFIPTTIVVNSNINDQPSTSPLDEQQQIDDQWQHPRGNGSAQRTGQFHNENHNQRNYHRRGVNHYHQQQQQQRGGGAPRGRYDNSYGGNQRQYNDQNRGRPGHRGGNRGGAHRGHYHNNNSGNGYQKSAQYQRGHSATAASQQQQQQQ